MKEIIEKIEAVYDAFHKDSIAQADKGNKAAGVRARRASLILGKLLKEFREKSIEASK